MQTRSEPLPEVSLLARGAVYGALARGFGPPDPEVVDSLASTDGWAHLYAALQELGLDRDVDLGTDAGSRTPDAIAARHATLFGHTVRGQVPPYETEYGADTLFQQPMELADLSGFLAAFGLVVAPDAHERVDHVRCECELMSFLACKEAVAASADGDAVTLDETRRAQRLFLRDHLGRFAPAFAARLAAADPGGFYGALGRVLTALVQADCRRLDIEAGADDLWLRAPAADDEVPMACGTGGASCGDDCPE